MRLILHQCCPTAEHVCCVRRCSSLPFARPISTSDTVLLAAFIVISTVVRVLLVRSTASAAACSSAA